MDISRIQEPYKNPSSAPELVQSNKGQWFDIHAERWQLSSRASLNVGLVRNLCWSPSMADGAIRTLAEYARKASPATVISVAKGFRRFLEFVPYKSGTDEISLSQLISYRDFCRRRDGHDYQISSYIRPFLRRWHALNYPGTTAALIEMLDNWTLKNPEVGVSVNRLDPHQGPLMPDEHIFIASLWLTAFEKGDMKLEDYVMARLSSVTGRRPEQIIQIKFKDMDDSRSENIEPAQLPRRILLLHIPRIKGKGREWRAHFRSVPISADIWNLLIMQRLSVVKKLDKFLIDCNLSLLPIDLKNIQSEMPLIPAWQAMKIDVETIRNSVSRGHHGDAINKLRSLVTSDAWHPRASRINHALKYSTNLPSDMKVLNVTPRRLRYTRKFDLERAGCSPPVIAWNMDHSSTESLHTYSKNGPDRARWMGKALALKLAPFITMFQGRVVSVEDEAEGGDQPALSRILFPGLVPGATCATKRDCGMSAIPRPCYNGCPHFRPWVDGPHEIFLESLLEEREQLLKNLRPVEDRLIIEAADSLIVSVAQVIRLCDDVRAKDAQQRALGAALSTDRGHK